MPDAQFEVPRLAAIYDALEPDRRDLVPYLDMVGHLGAARVLDLGCGTGTFALMLAAAGFDVVGVDPAGGCLDVARAKSGSERVHWVHGDAMAPALRRTERVDVVTMTANVAQAITDPADWEGTLRAMSTRLNPGGRIVFETRDPAREAWRTWTKEASYRTTELPGVGHVAWWVELTDVSLPWVRFRWSYAFGSDGAILTSDSTLRFRGPEEVTANLVGAGYVVEDVLDAPDRPGLELVFLASRT